MKKKSNKKEKVVKEEVKKTKPIVVQKKIELKAFLILLGIMMLVSFALFMGTISLMQDDADYILDAHNLVNNGAFPGTHGTYLYHFVLSIFNYMFGISITVTKVLAFIWAIIGFYFTYKILQKVTNRFLSIAILFIYATNFGILFYSSSTMSESFFMMIQAIFIYLFINKYDLILSEVNKSNVVKYASSLLLFIVVLFLLSITKGIGIIATFSLVLFLLIHKKWLNAIVIGGIFGVFKFAFDTSMKAIFNLDALSNRSATIWLKNYYDTKQGTEDIEGMIRRIFINFDFHISADLMRILGFRDNKFLEPVTFLTVLFFILFVVGLVYTFKNRKKLFYIGLYLSMMMGVTFLVLQTHWKQDRMIIVFIPFILLFIFESYNYWLRKKESFHIRLFNAAVVILCLVNLRHLPDKIDENNKPLQNYLSGEVFQNYERDWQNYLLAVDWASENLPEGSVVACRKPNSAMVYSKNGIQFVGLYRSTQLPGDEVLKELKELGVTHILQAQIRLNPAQYVPGRFIGTVHTYVRSISNYNPSKLKVLKKIGNLEEAYVLEIVD